MVQTLKTQTHSELFLWCCNVNILYSCTISVVDIRMLVFLVLKCICLPQRQYVNMGRLTLQHHTNMRHSMYHLKQNCIITIMLWMYQYDQNVTV